MCVCVHCQLLCLHMFLLCIRVYVAWVVLCVYEICICALSVCEQRPGYCIGVWSRCPWLVGDVGIRGRLERWLHSVFALMISTVCSSYQPRCTGFHGCHWYEITHGLLWCTLPSISPPTTTPSHQSERGVTLWQSGQTNSLGKKIGERDMDMWCSKFIGWGGDSLDWPLDSTEALARVLIVHWDNTLTPWRALGLQCNVPAQPQHITEGEVGGNRDKVSNVLKYTMVWVYCTFSGCWGEVSY